MDGRLARETLRHLRYNQLQQLAAEGDADGVNGNSEMGAIIDAYATDEEG
ncbi:hypothetical protein [Haloferax volcanii]|nr:hypothetical protein [Haloferax alexandrinus]WEL29853.1 hypothetical protein HBNXHx_1747 [Haloferax alexandrinus]